MGVDIGPGVAPVLTSSLADRTSVVALPHTTLGAAAELGVRAIEQAIPRALPLPDILSRRRAILKGAFEAAPAVITLAVVSFMIWGPVVLPLPFIFGILGFHAYWMYKTQMNGAHAVKGYLLLRKHKKTDWRAIYEKQVAAGTPALKWDDVRHIVIIPNYTESAEKLRLCLDSLASAEMADRIVAVLAMEEREGEAARQRARVLCGEYQGRIGQIFATYHPWGLPGEVVGKSSNENWAAREAKRRLVDLQGWDIDKITITSCDADTVFDPKYFSCLTYHFATHQDRYRRFWQSPIFFYNNIWEVPAPLRMAHCLSGLNHISRLTRSFFRMVFPQSTYSLSLRMAHDVGYWDPDIIPEDWHMFLKCYYAFGGRVDVDTMYTVLYMDGVRSQSYLATFNNYYQQSKRHAWGCTDIAYAVRMSIDHPEIPLAARLRRLWAVSECHLLWSTQWFLITTSKIIPFLAVGLVGSDALPGWYPLASRWVLLPCLATLLLLLYLDFQMRPQKPQWFRIYHWPVQYAVYFFMAFITFFSSCLPALDAQLRLAIGKRLEYRVTEKA